MNEDADERDDLGDEESSGDEALAPSNRLIKRVQDQINSLTENTIDSVPLRLVLSSLGEDGWLKNFYVNPLDPSRLQAMADAGLFLKDARELAGMSITDVATAVGLKDKDLLYEVERGESTLSFDMLFRIASLLARHDPLPFILKFARTYSPAVDGAMEKFGIAVIPKHIERERRFVNIYRRYDKLRQLSDEQYDRFCTYMESSADFVMGVMATEKAASTEQEAQVEADSENGASKAD